MNNSLLEQRTTIVKGVIHLVQTKESCHMPIRPADWGNIFIHSIADPKSDPNSEGEQIP